MLIDEAPNAGIDRREAKGVYLAHGINMKEMLFERPVESG